MKLFRAKSRTFGRIGLEVSDSGAEWRRAGLHDFLGHETFVFVSEDEIRDLRARAALGEMQREPRSPR